ncbi:MAG: serine/threonine protein kinase [Deltaproteobacteria bacterium]|nr:serine/threonine protein kinase [Deltaproteobacteria bacterium]
MPNDVFGIVGQTLAGSFRIESVVAEGGFGVVYRALHVAFRAPVALKCLKVPGTVTPEQAEDFVEKFREEAEILFHLSASIPEVVRPLHADALTLDDGTFVPFLAMEWVEGKPLDSLILLRQRAGKPPFSLRKLIQMLTPIAHALAKAHRFEVPGGVAVSISHCDLKPENIVITETDSPVRAKILDFGIAKARHTMFQRVGRITSPEEQGPFTPGYGAPEQWVPKRYGQTGPWTDVWGLALTMVEGLSGRPPIDGEMKSMMGTALDEQRRPTPRTEGVEVGDEVEDVFQRALAVDPRRRTQHLETFWEELELAAGLPSSFARAAKGRPRLSDEPEHVAPLRASDPGDLDELPAGARVSLASDPLSDSGSSDPFALDESGRPAREPGRLSLESDPGPGRAKGRSSFDPSQADAEVEAPAPAPRKRAGGEPALRSLGEQMRWPAVLMAVALVITLGDLFITRSTGSFLMLGPMRARWVAGIFALAGGALALLAFVQERDR